jgi:hypothetical protein
MTKHIIWCLAMYIFVLTLIPVMLMTIWFMDRSWWRELFNKIEHLLKAKIKEIEDEI